MNVILAGLGALAAVASFSSAAAESSIDIGKSGFDTCVANLDSRRAAKAALKDSGWRKLTGAPKVDFYSQDSFRVLIAHGKFKRKNICAFLVRDLTEERAIDIAESYLSKMSGVRQVEPSEPENVKEWLANFNGRAVRLFVTRQIKLNVVFGASVNLREQ